VAGLCLVYPGAGVPSERRLFIGAAMLGLSAVLHPHLIAAIAIAVAVIAVGGIRERRHYPALLGGIALPKVLSGLVDCSTRSVMRSLSTSDTFRFATSDTRRPAP
jgi:hypothetical protein